MPLVEERASGPVESDTAYPSGTGLAPDELESQKLVEAGGRQVAVFNLVESTTPSPIFVPIAAAPYRKG